MKKIIIPFIIMLISVNVYFMQQSNQKATEFQTSLNDLFEMSAFASGGDETGPDDGYGCGGNPTFLKNKALKSFPCPNLGTHKACGKEDQTCCDPSKGTDCKGLL